MKKIEIIIIISNFVLFVLVYSFLNLFFKNKQTNQKRKINLNLTYNPKGLIYIFMAALSLTYLLSSLTFNSKTDIVVFLSLMGLLPQAISGELMRRKKEDIFNNVILYCHNMAMLLKQNHNVYSSLQKVTEDISNPLKQDVVSLMESFDKTRYDSQKMMSYLEDKYEYSCIKDLDILLSYMFYENSNISDNLLDNFQDNIERLNQDVKDNESKRKTLRMEYILITVGSLFAYWYLLNEVKTTFTEVINSESFSIVNTTFIFVTLLCLFFVDHYFNTNMTKE